MRVLVAYASEHGSTREIAERIGAVLHDYGQQVEVCAVEEVYDLDDFSAVVVGSAVHNTAWMPTAQRFVERHRTELRRRRVWAFSVGMTGALRWPLRDCATRREEGKIGDDLRRRVLVHGHRLFSGVYQRDASSGWGRLLLMLVAGRYGDLRDWDQIEDFAGEIGASLARQPVR